MFKNLVTFWGFLVGMLIFYSNDLSLNPAEVNSIYSERCLKIPKIKRKRGRELAIKKSRHLNFYHYGTREFYLLYFH